MDDHPRRVPRNRTIGLRRLVERRPASRSAMAFVGDCSVTAAVTRSIRGWVGRGRCRGACGRGSRGGGSPGRVGQDGPVNGTLPTAPAEIAVGPQASYPGPSFTGRLLDAGRMFGAGWRTPSDPAVLQNRPPSRFGRGPDRCRNWATMGSDNPKNRHYMSRAAPIGSSPSIETGDSVGRWELGFATRNCHSSR